MVQTNVSYQAVAVIILASESKDSLVKALNILKDLNPNIHPKYLLTDNNMDEMNALEYVFPKSSVFIASFCAKQNWHQRIFMDHFLNVNRSEILSKLNDVLEATTDIKVRNSISEFKFCCPSIKEYFEKN